jgi:hypothetical protein
LIERVAAQMPVERVIDRMNCPATMKPTSATPMLSDHISESSTLTPTPTDLGELLARCWVIDRAGQQHQTQSNPARRPSTQPARKHACRCRRRGACPLRERRERSATEARRREPDRAGLCASRRCRAPARLCIAIVEDDLLPANTVNDLVAEMNPDLREQLDSVCDVGRLR